MLARAILVLRSFDLRSALTAAEIGCECPHHGTEKCNCQYVVLLIYGDAVEPITLTTHSHNHQTRAQIVRDATMNPDPHFVESVMAVLFEASLGISLPDRKELVGSLSQGFTYSN